MAALSVAIPTSAYVVTGDDWTWMGAPISEPFLVNANSFPGSAGPTADVDDRIHDAMDAWTLQGGADFAYVHGGTTNTYSWADSTDNVNVLQYVPSTTHPTAVALAQTWIAPPNDTVDCDVRFYGANGAGAIDWGSNDAGVGALEMDLERIAVHELGHCLGLNHSATPTAVMFATSPTGTPPALRLLDPDDIAGVQAIYGVPGADIIYDSHINDDDSPGPSIGDDDGVLEPGERIEVTIDAQNIGPGLAPGVQVTLSSSAFDIFPLTATQTIGDIASGAVETTSSPLLYMIRWVCSTNQTVTIDLLFEDTNGDSWTDSYSQDIVCDADGDGDGFAASADCDDTNAAINPGATEIWYDGINQNCDAASDYDQDGDGDDRDIDGGTDCDDTDPTILVGALETCDGVDENCNGSTDEGWTADGVFFYRDADGDTFGDPGNRRRRCFAEPGFVPDDTDCDDTDISISPAATEICDGEDTDCDGIVDNGPGFTWYRDADGDLLGDPADTVSSCTQPAGYVGNDLDCLDTDPLVRPGGVETCNGLDDDCDGTVDNGWVPDGTLFYLDSDGDGFGDASVWRRRCAAEPGYVGDATDCDDSDASVSGGVDYYIDSDSDGYGNPVGPVNECAQPAGRVADGTDCNDSNAAINPGAVEACNGTDDNCDGAPGASEVDADFDGLAVCDGDCDDADPNRFPGALEACDGVDNDCDGLVPGSESDSDGDGVLTCFGDCDDTDPLTWPGATELCDGIDNDCDLVTDEGATSVTWYADADGDGAGDPSDTTDSCSPVAGYVLNDDDCDDADPAVTDNVVWYRDADEDGFGDAADTSVSCLEPTGYVGDDTDCDDDNASANPGAEEQCDGQDSDCNGIVDDGDSDTTWYADLDGDGYGDPDDAITECSDGIKRVQNGDDCDDTEALANPGLIEVPYDGIDNDCDGADLCDDDGDGFSALACGGEDCDDGNDSIYPGAPEYLDDRDNDCDGLVDSQSGDDTDDPGPDTDQPGQRCTCSSRSGPLGAWPMLLGLLALRRRSVRE